MIQISVFTQDMVHVHVHSDAQHDGTPFAVVRVGSDFDLHVSGWAGDDAIRRGRAFAAAVNAACDAVEDALRRNAAVPVETLAPDHAELRAS